MVDLAYGSTVTWIKADRRAVVHIRMSRSHLKKTLLLRRSSVGRLFNHIKVFEKEVKNYPYIGVTHKNTTQKDAFVHSFILREYISSNFKWK